MQRGLLQHALGDQSLPRIHSITQHQRDWKSTWSKDPYHVMKQTHSIRLRKSPKLKKHRRLRAYPWGGALSAYPALPQPGYVCLQVCSEHSHSQQHREKRCCHSWLMAQLHTFHVSFHEISFLKGSFTSSNSSFALPNPFSHWHLKAFSTFLLSPLLP